MVEKTYNAKISIRAGETFCVFVPKELIDSAIFAVGETVKVSLRKEEVNK